MIRWKFDHVLSCTSPECALAAGRAILPRLSVFVAADVGGDADQHRQAGSIHESSGAGRAALQRFSLVARETCGTLAHDRNVVCHRISRLLSSRHIPLL